MIAENQLRRIELLEQQVSMFQAEQAASEARLESKLESFGSMLRSQLLTTLKELRAGIPGKTRMELGVGDFELSKQYCTNLVPIGSHLQEIDEDQHNRQLAMDGRVTMCRLLASNNTIGDHEKHEFVVELIVEKIKDIFHGSKLFSKSNIIALKPLVCSSGAWFDFHRRPAFWKFSGQTYFDYLRFKFKVLDNLVLDTVVGGVKEYRSGKTQLVSSGVIWTEEKVHPINHTSGKNGGVGVESTDMLVLCGLRYYVNGLRGFPWLTLNFHMTHYLNMNPSTLQPVRNFGNLPMVAKPLYEILSDALYIPLHVFFASLAPQGCKGSLMSFFAFALCLSSIFSGFLGIGLAAYLGIASENYSSFPLGILIQFVAALLPRWWIDNLPADDGIPKRESWN